MSPDEDLDGLPHAFAEGLREFRLALPGVPDRRQQLRGGSLGLRNPEIGAQQGAQRRDLRRQFALLEPQVDVPLAPRLVVETGE
ncbi:MAG: hypothetical protein F4075_06890 [Acidobacteria bacterium]|nr:hypothetical protein [Acidobacteriota bacterium]